jgi:hypothetical protein
MEPETSGECLTGSQMRDLDHGVEIRLEDIRSALGDTRMVRLAIDTLSDLPPGVATSEVHAAIGHIEDALCEAELANLKAYGLSRAYLIIRPINPMNPPEPEVMKQITAAIRTLSELGLIVPAD